MAVRSKSYVSSRLTAGVAGSNPAESGVSSLVHVVCCVGSDLCDELITRSEESYWVCVCVCVFFNVFIEHAVLLSEVRHAISIIYMYFTFFG